MKVSKKYPFVLTPFLIVVLALLLISPPLYAATILGKAAVYTSSGIETYPNKFCHIFLYFTQKMHIGLVKSFYLNYFVSNIREVI